MSGSVLEVGTILLDGAARSRDAAIREAGSLLVAVGAVSEAYVPSMVVRERSLSTYMGSLLAIPHGTNDAKHEIVRTAVSLVRYTPSIDWDDNEVRFVVGIAAIGDEHLELLGKLAVVFSDDDEVGRLLDARCAEEIVAILGEVNGR